MSVNEVANLETLLSANPYPGRGIVLGQTPDGTRMVVAYFIMGRSPNSRNRVFERTEDGIRTRAYDPSKVEDPSLIIYNPLRTVDGALIVTNGDVDKEKAKAKAEGVLKEVQKSPAKFAGPSCAWLHLPPLLQRAEGEVQGAGHLTGTQAGARFRF